MNQIINFLEEENISYNRDVDLKTKTWIKRGGITKLWVQPTKMTHFENLIAWCQINKIIFEVVGNTSNCYFLNDYHPLLVISTLKLNKMSVDGDTITCDCGYNMARLAKFCNSEGIAGYEGFIGLPGTVGGAAINNAGCYGSLISDLVVKLHILHMGKSLILTNEQLKYSHRDSVLKSLEIDGVVTSVIFKIIGDEDPSVLEKRAQNFQSLRKATQEHTYPNLGSTFCTMEFKEHSFFMNLITSFIYRFLNLVVSKNEIRQKLRTKFFLKLRSAGKFREYISDYWVGCFTWRNEGADRAFIDYLDFINKETSKAVLEIDIKGKL